MNVEDRLARIEAIVDEVVDRCARGESIDVDDICEAHADLLPELRQRCHTAIRAFESSSKEGPASDPEITVTRSAAEQVFVGDHGGDARALSAVDPAGHDIVGDAGSIPERLGTIRLLDEIGSGGMGTVYEGWDEVLSRRVAVKFLRRNIREVEDPVFQQFLAGARSEASARHPNIVEVYAAGVEGSLPYTVMRLVDGESLRTVIRETSLSVAAACYVIHEVSAAVGFVHGSGVVHRDIKPDNILIDKRGNLFVTDFGLAMLRRVADGRVGSSGTPAYMAPESFDHRVTPQGDVYAIGIMFYELLRGRVPYTGDMAQLRDAHSRAPLPLGELPVDVDDQLREILERATHKNATMRYKSAAHLRERLAASVEWEVVRKAGRDELASAVARVRSGDSNGERAGVATSSVGEGDYFERVTELATDRKRRAVEGKRITGRLEKGAAREMIDPGMTFAEKMNRLRVDCRRRGSIMMLYLLAGFPAGMIYALKRFLFPSTPTVMVVLWVALIIVPLVYFLYRRILGVRLPPPGYCDRCGYDLAGNESGRCSECGRDRELILDPAAIRLRRCPFCSNRLPRSDGPAGCAHCGFDAAGLRASILLRDNRRFGLYSLVLVVAVALVSHVGIALAVWCCALPLLLPLSRYEKFVFTRDVMRVFGDRRHRAPISITDVQEVRYDPVRGCVLARLAAGELEISKHWFGDADLALRFADAMRQWTRGAGVGDAQPADDVIDPGLRRGDSDAGRSTSI